MKSFLDIQTEDAASIEKAAFIPWEKLKNTTILVTGATGLIGTAFINALSYINKAKSLNLQLIALVRDERKATEKYKDLLADGILSLVVGEVEHFPIIEHSVDYILHAASQTASKEFVNHPIETIETAVLGTLNILEFARDKSVKGFVYLSSMEVYGYPQRGHIVTEDDIGALTTLDVRNSYPLSKMMSESICCAYSKEYGVPAKICRLTQTFGPGVSYNDNRIFAYFARCVKEKKNIVLKTKGETERCYLYTADAVTGILTVLLNGVAGRAYNIADETNYCSIRKMAEIVANDAGIKVEYDLEDDISNGFAKTLFMKLDTSSLRQLGWVPLGYSISEMYLRMLSVF